MGPDDGGVSMQSIVEIPFYSDNIQAVREGEQVWVVIKRVCEALGLDHASQLEKLKAKPWATIGLIPTVAEDGKQREIACVDLKSLPMWLATIDAGRVKPEARFQLVAYQRECADALARHFFGASVINRDQSGEISGLRDDLRNLTNNVAALWGHVSQGGYIARARFEALRSDWQGLADVEVAVGKWPTRRAALADIQRDMRDATEWGGKSKPWSELPAALEPAARAVLKRRMRDATKREKPRQLSLIHKKSG